MFSRKCKTNMALTKGAALLKAREVLGPAASVKFDCPPEGIQQCVVFQENSRLGEDVSFAAPSWEEALRAARKWQGQEA